MGYKDDPYYSYYNLKDLFEGTGSYNTNTFGLFDKDGKAVPARQAYEIGDIVRLHNPDMECPLMMVTVVNEEDLVVMWFGYPNGPKLVKQYLNLPRKCFKLVQRVSR